MTLRILYTDLDGTLLGPGGSLFATSEGPSLGPARALVDLARAEVALIPITGRTEQQSWEAARILGAVDRIAELGGIVHREGRRLVNHGDYRGAATPVRAMLREGAAGLVLDRFSGALEPHAPWAFLPRECTMLLRGKVDPADVDEELARAGFAWLHLVDNGRIPHPGTPQTVHVYHLAPRGVDKASAVAADLAARGLDPENAAIVGDGPAEAAVAPHIGSVYIVANGEGSLGDSPKPENLVITTKPRGEGFAEAVEELLS